MKRFFTVSLVLGVLVMVFTKFSFVHGEPAEYETIKGQLICVGCTLKKEYGAKAKCSAYGHKFGLRTNDGKIWSFLENDKSTELINNQSFGGKMAEVEGKKFPIAQVIEVDSYRILSEGKQKVAPEASTHKMSPEAKSY